MICPDNSTECLLRALVNAGNSFDWNPLNFAFTAATGILALIIACIAVFQGLLAAGPGRLKASRSAIGPWSEKSKSRFDWVELGLRTTAQVPFMQLKDLDNLLAPGGRAARKASNSKAVTDVAASWLPLLQRARLADPYFWETRPIATDYLPDDVRAAPASASVLCLVLLALLADTDAVIDYKGGSRLVRVQGATSELTIREHPILGPVAVYEIYGLPNPMSYPAAQVSLAFARGQMTCGEAVLPTRDFLQISSNVPGLRHVERLCQTLSLAYPNNPQVNMFESWAKNGRWGTEASFTGFLLLCCDVPAGIRSFPCRRLHPQRIIKKLFMNGDLFANAEDLIVAIREANSVGNREFPPWFESHTINNVQMADYSERKHTSWLLLSDSNPRLFRPRWASRALVEICSSWVRQIEADKMAPTVPFRSLCDNVPRVFLELKHQLRMLDRFLSCYYLDEAASSALIMLSRMDAASHGKTIERSYYSYFEFPGSRPMPSERDFQNLAMILAFRAILFAAILELCGDTSFVYDGSWRDSVVKIL